MADLSERLARLTPDQKARLAAKVAQRKEQVRQGYAVVGVACRLPSGISDVDNLWSFLQGGQRAEAASAKARTAPSLSPPVNYLEDVDLFDAEFFRIPAREARAMEATQRVALETVGEAVEQAGLTAAGTQSVGVFVGARTVAESCRLNAPESTGPDLLEALGCSNNLIAQRMSFHFRWTGPSMLVDTGCTSSFTALHLALKSLDSGDCTAAVVVGVNLIQRPDLGASMAELEILSKDGVTRCFDAAGDGYGRSEACVALVVKPLHQALADGDPIWIAIRGVELAQVGESDGLTAPNGLAQQRLIQRVWKKVGVQPGEFAYVEAQAAATPLADALEFEALAATYGALASPRCHVGSIKANLGHAEGASGLVGLLKAALVLRQGEVPPQPEIEVLNPDLPLTGRLAIANQPSPLAEGLQLAAVHQFGFGGGMGHAVLERIAPRTSSPQREGGPAILALTARTEEALQQSVRPLLTSLEGRPDLTLAQICAAVNRVRGRGYGYRLSVRAEEVSLLKELLEGYAQGREDARLRVSPPNRGARITVRLSLKSGTPGADLEQTMAGFRERYRPLGEHPDPPAEDERVRRAMGMWLTWLGVEELPAEDPSEADFQLFIGAMFETSPAAGHYQLPQDLAAWLTELYHRGLDLPWPALSGEAPDWNPPGHPRQRQPLSAPPELTAPLDLRAEVAGLLGIEPDQLDERRMLLDYGLDSLKRMQLRARLAERHGQTVPIEAVTRATTLKELEAHWSSPPASPTSKPQPAASFSYSSLCLLLGCLSLWALVILDMAMDLDPSAPLRGDQVRSTSGGPMSELESHFDKGFGFRNGLIRSYGWLSLRLLQSAPERSFLFTPGDWFLSREELSPAPAALEEVLRQWGNYFDSTGAWLAARGIRYLVVITPLRTDTYPERIPPGFASVAWRRRALERLRSARESQVFDAITALDPWKSRISLPLFEPTGAHWNSLGGSLAAMGIVAHLRPWFPQLPTWSTEQLELGQETNFGSDFTWRIGAERFIAQEEIHVLPSRRRYAFRDSGLLVRHPDWVHPYGSELTDKRLPRALMFHDSTALCMRPVLRQSFSRFVSVRNPSPPLVERAIVLRERPQLVIQVMNSLTLLNSMPVTSSPAVFLDNVPGPFRSAAELFPDAETALANCCQQPPLNWLRPLPPSRWEESGLRILTPSGPGGARFSLPQIPAGQVALLHLAIQSPGSAAVSVNWGAHSHGASVRLDLTPGDNEFFVRLDKLRSVEPVSLVVSPSLLGETIGHVVTHIEVRLAPLSLAGLPLCISP